MCSTRNSDVYVCLTTLPPILSPVYLCTLFIDKLSEVTSRNIGSSMNNGTFTTAVVYVHNKQQTSLKYFRPNLLGP